MYTITKGQLRPSPVLVTSFNRRMVLHRAVYRDVNKSEPKRRADCVLTLEDSTSWSPIERANVATKLHDIAHAGGGLKCLKLMKLDL